jgi:hypothetical protein
MAGVVRYGAPNDMASFIDSADPVYGTGADGSVTLDGTTTILGMIPSSNVYSMTSDLYFHNLTINAGVRLAPNGYRIFVKNILTLNNNSTIGYTTGYSTAGSIAQGGAATTAVTHSLGGSATGYSATAPTAALGGSKYYQIPHQAIRGWAVSASSTTPTFLRGGAGGSGQAGGGVVIVAARYLSGPSTGTAYIKAPGTAPAGGGVILIISTHSALPASISTDITGQNPGTVNYMQLV